jgi:hypothetical protein
MLLGASTACFSSSSFTLNVARASADSTRNESPTTVTRRWVGAIAASSMRTSLPGALPHGERGLLVEVAARHGREVGGGRALQPFARARAVLLDRDRQRILLDLREPRRLRRRRPASGRGRLERESHQCGKERGGGHGRVIGCNCRRHHTPRPPPAAIRGLI